MRGRGKWSFGQTLLIWRKSTQVLQDLSFFGTITGFANHSEWNISLMNPAANSLAISCPMAFLFSEENRGGTLSPVLLSDQHVTCARPTPLGLQACQQASMKRCPNSHGGS